MYGNTKTLQQCAEATIQPLAGPDEESLPPIRYTGFGAQPIEYLKQAAEMMRVWIAKTLQVAEYQVRVEVHGEQQILRELDAAHTDHVLDLGVLLGLSRALSRRQAQEYAPHALPHMREIQCSREEGALVQHLDPSAYVRPVFGLFLPQRHTVVHLGFGWRIPPLIVPRRRDRGQLHTRNFGISKIRKSGLTSRIRLGPQWLRNTQQGPCGKPPVDTNRTIVLAFYTALSQRLTQG